MKYLFYLILIVFLFTLSEYTYGKQKITEDFILKVCKENKYDNCNLVNSIINTESRFNPLAYHPEKTGSYGLMQIQCSTARERGLKDQCHHLFDPKTNIKYGILHLKWIEKQLYKPTIRDIVASYNAGYKKLYFIEGCTKRRVDEAIQAKKNLSIEQKDKLLASCTTQENRPRRCKNYNEFKYESFPTQECYPEEYINEEYVWKVMRRYKYLTDKE